MSKFGEFSLRLDNRVIVAHLSGISNASSVLAYSHRFKQLVKSLAPGPWAHIVYLDDWQLGTPEIEPIVEQLVLWCELRQLAFTAQVLNPHSLKEFQLDKMIQQGDTHSLKRFDNESDAFRWLSYQGFDVLSPYIVA